MSSSVLRPATDRDFAFVRSVAGRPENQHFIEDAPEDALQMILSNPDAAFVIWEHDGQPAGFAMFHGCAQSDVQIELRRLALDRTDQGLGQPFLRALIAFAFESLGTPRLWLDVAPENARAIRSYEKAGFTPAPEGTAIWHRPDGVDVELLVFHMLKPTEG
ncbi:GNAT family N-acetyltransferase [uncultured Shimia sp.]|uniref:GNAT family N-acetyltransferase n=1 Tax=uncultured Shimia sp. TaxID=573152 RepID=UPI0026306573|nr:GNAT family N-acetyltransferase [uncultured Shimia sp.]